MNTKNKKIKISIILIIIISIVGTFFYKKSKEVNIYTEVFSKAEQCEEMSMKSNEVIKYDNGIKNVFSQNSLVKINKKNQIYEKITIKTHYTNETNTTYYDLNQNNIFSSRNDYKKETLIHANDITRYICLDLLDEIFNSKSIKQEKSENKYIVTGTIKNPNEFICKMSISNDNLFNVYGYAEKESCPVKLIINKNYEIETIEVDLLPYVKKALSSNTTDSDKLTVQKATLKYSFDYSTVKITNFPK